jgi:hypothetical protein
MVLNSTKFGMDKSDEKNYKNLENHLKNRTLETSNSNVIVSNSVNIVPSQPLNSTFSLECGLQMMLISCRYRVHVKMLYVKRVV